MSQHVATRWSNAATQHVAPNNDAICCVGMLRSFGRGSTFQRNISHHCYVRLATLLRRVATCWPGVVGSNLKMVKFFMQHLWMLYDVVVVWPGSSNNVAPGHAH